MSPNTMTIHIVITLLCFIGGYTENNTLFTMWMVMVFGLIGFLFKKLDYPLAPLVVAIVLGDDTEAALRRGLIMSHGTLGILFTRPVSLALLLLAAVLFFLPVISSIMKKRRRSPGRPAEAIPS